MRGLILVVVGLNFHHLTFIILLVLVLMLIIIVEEIVLLDVFISWDCFRDSAARSEWLVLIHCGLWLFLFISLFIVWAFLDLLQLLIIGGVLQRVLLWVRRTWRVFSLNLSPLLIKLILLYFLYLHEIMKFVIVVFRFNISSSKISCLTFSNLFVETIGKLISHWVNILLSLLLGNILLHFHISLPFFLFIIWSLILWTLLPVEIIVINLLVLVLIL